MGSTEIPTKRSEGYFCETQHRLTWVKPPEKSKMTDEIVAINRFLDILSDRETSSDDDDEEVILTLCMSSLARTNVQRSNNFVEKVLNIFTDVEFQENFR